MKNPILRSHDNRVSLRRDDYAIIGRELVLRNLPIAIEIIQDRIQNGKREWNLENISSYYLDGMDRRLFVGAILFEYHTELQLAEKRFVPNRGVFTRIARTLKITLSYTSQLAHEVVLQLRVYDDFREKVKEHIKYIKASEA